MTEIEKFMNVREARRRVAARTYLDDIFNYGAEAEVGVIRNPRRIQGTPYTGENIFGTNTGRIRNDRPDDEQRVTFVDAQGQERLPPGVYTDELGDVEQRFARRVQAAINTPPDPVEERYTRAVVEAAVDWQRATEEDNED